MLAAHLIVASLATAGPATIPTTVPENSVVEASPIGPSPPSNPQPDGAVLTDGASPAVAEEPHPAGPSTMQQAAAREQFDLELDQNGLDKDTLAGFNRLSFGLSQALDKVLIRPAAMVYRYVVPRPARDGVHNALSNLGEPLVFLNDLLQLRPDRAIRTLGRFLLNSTLGIGGLFDIARRKPFHLMHHANGFGDTLGYYGVKPGPYIYLPVLGPTTLRDAIGSAEELLPPMVVGAPFDRKDYQIATNVADGLDQRERADDDLKVMLRDAIDPYATFRANFLQNRAGEIAALKSRQIDPGNASTSDDPLVDPLTDPAAPANEVSGQ